ncbi:hypothetical protein, partial [Mesorhizobium sp.]|uniref:hypothetical protein n=1 Tax=Mesorhizobium sp. TaxID=1871066 RepID=UPI00257DF660
PITGERIIRNAEDKKKQHQLMLAALRKISIKNNIWLLPNGRAASTHMEIPCGTHLSMGSGMKPSLVLSAPVLAAPKRWSQNAGTREFTIGRTRACASATPGGS